MRCQRSRIRTLQRQIFLKFKTNWFLKLFGKMRYTKYASSYDIPCLSKSSWDVKIASALNFCRGKYGKYASCPKTKTSTWKNGTKCYTLYVKMDFDYPLRNLEFPIFKIGAYSLYINHFFLYTLETTGKIWIDCIMLPVPLFLNLFYISRET